MERQRINEYEGEEMSEMFDGQSKKSLKECQNTRVNGSRDILQWKVIFRNA